MQAGGVPGPPTMAPKSVGSGRSTWFRLTFER